MRQALFSPAVRRGGALAAAALAVVLTACGATAAAPAHRTAGHAAAGATAPAARSTAALPVMPPGQNPILHVPANLPAGKVPLVIALHGSGGTTQGTEGTGLNALADRYGFIVAYLGSASPGATFKSPSDTDYVAAMIRQYEATEPIDPSRVYVTGFSAGGYESYRVGCVYSNLVAAVAPIAVSMNRTLYDTCRPRRPVSILIVIGSADVNHFGGIGVLPSAPAAAARWRALDSCPGQAPAAAAQLPGPTQQQLWSGCADGSAVGLDVIVGGGHVWPGPWLGAGNPDGRFNATSAIWQFFSGRRAGSLTAPAAALKGVRSFRHGHRRLVRLSVSAEEPVRVKAWIGRRGRRLAVRSAALGRALAGQLTLRLPARFARAHYRLSVVISDAYGRRSTVTRTLLIGP